MIRTTPCMPLAACLALSAPALPAQDPLPGDEETLTVLVGGSRSLVPPFEISGASLADPLVADVQVARPDLLLVSGKAAGRTDLLVWDERGETAKWRVEVAYDFLPLEAQLASLFPGSDIAVRSIGETLAITGRLESANQAESLHAYLDAGGVKYVDLTVVPGVQQVQVLVRIAEVSRTGIRTLGINGFGAGSDAFVGSTIGPQGGPINPISIGPPEGAPVTDVPFVFNQAVNVSPAVTLFAGVPSADLEVFIQALAQDQYLRLLAEPNLVALSGEEASFLAGGEFPIPVVQGGGSLGSASITIEYKEFGVGLKFRPVVLGEGAIRLEVVSEVSELSDLGAVEIQGFRVPTIVTRRVLTTLEMKSGQTFAMAGLLSETVNAQNARTPWLGAIPVLGSLFRSARYRKGETELLVLVTASLVEPSSQKVLPPLPGDLHIVPSDWELFALGRIEGRAPARRSPADAEWLRARHLDRLQGPGAWGTHEADSPRTSVRFDRATLGADEDVRSTGEDR